MLLQCRYGGNTETSVVSVTTPNVQIVTADDLNLESKVNFAVDGTVQSTLDSMANLQVQVFLAQQNLSAIAAALSLLDFNVTALVPYQNFTALRKQVADKVAALGAGSSSGSDCSSGPFGSAGCWIDSALSIIVTIIVVAVIAVAVYFVCVKGVMAKSCAKDDE